MALKEFQLTINVPEEVLSLIKELAPGQTPEDNVRISLAIGLFLAKSISLGKASEMAGLSLNDFIFLLQANKLPWKSYGEEDLKYDELAVKESYKEYQNDLRDSNTTAPITEKVNSDGKNSIMQKLKFTVTLKRMKTESMWLQFLPYLAVTPRPMI